MEQSRSTLLPNIIHYLKKQALGTVSNVQLVLRGTRKNNVVTDGFFAIDVNGISCLEQSTFIRVQLWRLALDVDHIQMIIDKWENLGVEIMSEYQIKPINHELQIKALMVPAFRKYLKTTIEEIPMSQILETTKNLY